MCMKKESIPTERWNILCCVTAFLLNKKYELQKRVNCRVDIAYFYSENLFITSYVFPLELLIPWLIKYAVSPCHLTLMFFVYDIEYPHLLNLIQEQ